MKQWQQGKRRDFVPTYAARDRRTFWRKKHDMKDDAIISRIANMTMRIPIAAAQMNLNVSKCFPIRVAESQSRRGEIGTTEQVPFPGMNNSNVPAIRKSGSRAIEV